MWEPTNVLRTRHLTGIWRHGGIIHSLTQSSQGEVTAGFITFHWWKRSWLSLKPVRQSNLPGLPFLPSGPAVKKFRTVCWSWVFTLHSWGQVPKRPSVHTQYSSQAASWRPRSTVQVFLKLEVRNLHPSCGSQLSPLSKLSSISHKARCC